MGEVKKKAWWESFFDQDYASLWSGFFRPEETSLQVEQLWELLKLKPGSRILDAPCGYGRQSRPLAERGAQVLGVDQSRELLDKAELERGGISEDRLRYRRHDLRLPLSEDGFEVAINIFSSLGYATQAEDLAILENLCASLKPGGLLFVETNHRDAVVTRLYRSDQVALRLPDGTLMVEEPVFDSITGRVETTWYWSGPSGRGQKSASLRLYSATELVRLVEKAGFQLRSTHCGCSLEPFRGRDPVREERLGILAQKER